MGPADGCDLGVEALDRQACTGPLDHYRPEPSSSPGIKWLNEVTKRGEEVSGCGQQACFSPPVWEAFDPVANLGNGDCCGAELVCAPPAEPLPHSVIGCRPHQLRDHVGVKDYQSWNSAARGMAFRGGRSSSTPPSSPKRAMIASAKLGPSSGSRTASTRIARTSASMDLPWRAARIRSSSKTRSSRFLMLIAAMNPPPSAINASSKPSRWASDRSGIFRANRSGCCSTSRVRSPAA